MFFRLTYVMMLVVNSSTTTCCPGISLKVKLNVDNWVQNELKYLFWFSCPVAFRSMGDSFQSSSPPLSSKCNKNDLKPSHRRCIGDGASTGCGPTFPPSSLSLRMRVVVTYFFPLPCLCIVTESCNYRKDDIWRVWKVLKKKLVLRRKIKSYHIVKKYVKIQTWN